MPVILTSPEEVQLWLMADPAKALELQRPLPDEALKIVARGEKEDRAPEREGPATTPRPESPGDRPADAPDFEI
jgi:putative SOS response-associated peptidase YedK